jgi:signal transduction histidine kinase
LQASYRALTARLERLDLELAERNEALRRNLRENEEMRDHLSAILESLSTGVIVADRAGVVTRCNQAAERLTGVTRAAMTGESLPRLLRQVGLDGDHYPVEARSGAYLTVTRTDLRNQAGESTGSLVLLQDITEIRRLEEQVQRRDRLVSMGEMVGRIAHEIRNPLGSIELFASMLRRGLDGARELKAYADHISSAVHAMDRLLTNVLLYVRPKPPKARWHSAAQVVRDALALAAHATVNRRIATRASCDPRATRVWCDALQLKQALLNLILNAIQAMPDGGVLRVAVHPDRTQCPSGPGVRIAVSDTGSGIDPAHRSRIFDPFFTTKDAGTGLGLAIVHAIVESHRGRIEVESTVGRGTTFSIVLPAGPAADGDPVSGGRRRSGVGAAREAATPEWTREREVSDR